LVTDSTGGTVQVFSINDSTGALTSVGSPVLTAAGAGSGPDSVVVDPSGRGFVYVGDQNGGLPLAAYNLDTSGTLTAMTPLQPNFAQSSVWVSIDPTGRFLYSSGISGGNPSVLGWTIDPSTGALTAITMTASAAFTAGGSPGVMAIDPTGQFLYVTDQNNGQLVEFAISQTTGALTALSSSPITVGSGAASAPYGVSIDPSGQFLYVGNTNDGTISEFTLNSGTGALTAVGGSPVNSGGNLTNDPSSIAIE